MAVTKNQDQPFNPGLALVDGTQLNNVLANPARSAGAGLTATGANLAGALVLSQAINVISVAAAGTGVALANLKPGQSQIVFNDGANAIKVYSNFATIDGGAGSGGVTLTNASRCQYICTAPGVIKSALLGAVSA